MSRPLRGQVAIITGASRGIGRDIALTLAKEGVNIAVCAKSVSDTPNLPGTIYSVAKEVESLGVEALPLKCDVRSDEDLQNVVQQTIKKWGRIDILINNAGALWWKDVVDTEMKRYDLVNQINSRATFALTRLCLPHMIKQGYGHIIVMSPPIDLDLLPGKVAYCISKFGMTFLALGLGTASILSDAVKMIVQEDPNTFSGQALIDEDYMRSRGVTWFKKYRCDPDVEPPRMTKLPTEVHHGVGIPSERKNMVFSRSKL